MSAPSADMQGLPEILRPHRKAVRMHRKKMVMLLCACATEVAPDVIQALSALMPGQKKAKVRDEATFPLCENELIAGSPSCEGDGAFLPGGDFAGFGQGLLH